MMLPLRVVGGEHIGLPVLAYKIPPGTVKSEKDFFATSAKLRDDLQKRIPGDAGLSDSAK